MVIIADFGQEATSIPIGPEIDLLSECERIAKSVPPPIRFIVDRQARGIMDIATMRDPQRDPRTVFRPRREGEYGGTTIYNIPMFFFEELEYVE